MSPVGRTRLTTFVCALSLGLALYLALLKFFALPCAGPGGCQTVIFSVYGSVFHVPVGVYGALLWIAIILVNDRSKRGILLLLMAGSSLFFMGIQFLVLRSFCLFCTAHALLSWLALWLHGERPHRWALPLGLFLAAAGFAGTRHLAAVRVQVPALPASAAGPAVALTADAGFAWLGDIGPDSPVLVLSLDCPACLDLIGELTRRSYATAHYGPAVYLKTTDKNRALTVEFAAAVLAQPAAPRDAFLAAATLLLTQKDAVLSAPSAARESFSALFPAVTAEHRNKASHNLAAQTRLLAAARLPDTTPLLVPSAPSAPPKAFFNLDELFPRHVASRRDRQDRAITALLDFGPVSLKLTGSEKRQAVANSNQEKKFRTFLAANTP